MPDNDPAPLAGEVTMAELARHYDVSRPTLDLLRRQGKIVARERTIPGIGHRFLVFDAAAVHPVLISVRHGAYWKSAHKHAT